MATKVDMPFNQLNLSFVNLKLDSFLASDFSIPAVQFTILTLCKTGTEFVSFYYKRNKYLVFSEN